MSEHNHEPGEVCPGCLETAEGHYSRLEDENGRLAAVAEFWKAGVRNSPMCTDEMFRQAERMEKVFVPILRDAAAARVEPDYRELSGLRLNLGCGRAPEAGWVNVDLRPGPGVDVLQDLDLEGCLGRFATESAERVRAWGLLEHLPHWENLVLEAARVLVEAGAFEIRVPYRMDYVAYHVRHFNKDTFNPYRSDYRPRELDLVRRPHAWGSLEFSRPYFTLHDRWVEHWVPFSWHARKYLHVNLARLPLGRRLNLHITLRRNDTPWTSS